MIVAALLLLAQAAPVQRTQLRPAAPIQAPASTGLGVTVVPAAPKPAPAVETDPKRLAWRVAASGTLAQLARFAIEKDIRELLDANRGLPTADQAVLGRIAADKAAEAQKTLIEATADSYAATLSVAEMQAIVAFNDSPAAAKWRAAEPAAVAALRKGLAGYDFKKDVLEVMCFRTRKACPAKDGK